MQNFKGNKEFTFIDENKEKFKVNLPYGVVHYNNEDIAVIDVSRNASISKYVGYAGAILKTNLDSNDTNDLSRILLEKRYFEISDKEQQKFIFFHEIGHIKEKHEKRTLKNEIEADKYSISITQNYHAALTFLQTSLKMVTGDKMRNELIARIDTITNDSLASSFSKQY